MRTALVMGGTGMLTGCAERLVANGWHVVLPCRHYAPLAADHHSGCGRATWVEVDWSKPQLLASRTARIIDNPAELLITWLPDDTLAPALRAVEPLLAPGAPVVEAHDRPSTTALPDHPTQHVVLSPVGYAGRTRRPSSAEITEGILRATRRALIAH
ncbi:hypothetical protein JOD54_005675 [Actinokineospora baliensis]|nr:hypothetical protein [Actinokineospora baliensis]MBM7775471.1 hypothetical protein [Actinokineospora baliensis]